VETLMSRGPLTSREIDVLLLVGRGNSTKEIAETLHLSVHTVCNHWKHLCQKLGCQSAAQLIVYAAKAEWHALSKAASR
jgi:DNA-binding NarL/FixJ family response regulator